MQTNKERYCQLTMKKKHVPYRYKILPGVRLFDSSDIKLFILVGWDRSSFVCCLVHRGSTDNLLLLQISSGAVWQSRDLQLSRNTLCLLSPRLCFFIVLKYDLFVYRDDSLTG